jgi:hypothetical protein
MKSAVKIRFSILIVVLFFASCTSTAVTLSEEQEETLSKKGVAFEEIQMAEIKADEPGRAVLQRQERWFWMSRRFFLELAGPGLTMYSAGQVTVRKNISRTEASTGDLTLILTRLNQGMALFC